MQLIVAEKPSVARDLARVLGVRGGGRGAFEGPQRVITWCIGHLVELEEPAAYDPRWKPWRMATLPMLPEPFKLRPSKSSAAQWRVVAALLREKRFTEVINACDAGREGELIFRYLCQLASCRLPVRRLWISSLTDEAVRAGFAALRPGSAFDALAEAARCRSEADWLVGLNATRALTIKRRAGEDSPLLSIGRVQTPTLAMLVKRERTIRDFVPRDYFEVRAELATADGQRFPALFHSGNLSRFGARAIAEAIAARDQGFSRAADPASSANPANPSGPRVERLRARTVREPPPLLFDLTSLQRTANRRFGMSAARTLSVAQSLYEQHKVLTYPRTDSRHLTGDVARELPKLFAALAKLPDYARFAAPLVEHPPRPGRRIVDDARVSDHHAIIPTGKAIDLDKLDPEQRRIFDLVVRRFLGAFHPDAEFAVTDVVVRVGPGDGPLPPAPSDARAPEGDARPRPGATDDGEATKTIVEMPALPDRYRARGRVRLVAGWQEVAGIDPASARRERGDRGKHDDDPDRPADEPAVSLPVLVEGQRLDGEFAAVARKTAPPPRLTEATLLSAMESAGRALEDDELRQAMRDTGLGTPATRAAIIETLLERRYVVREGKSLVVTPMGMALIETLPVPGLASPELTGAWEARLARIARGEERRDRFMSDIREYVTGIVSAIASAEGTPVRYEPLPAARDGAAPAPPAEPWSTTREPGGGRKPRGPRTRGGRGAVAGGATGARTPAREGPASSRPARPGRKPPSRAAPASASPARLVCPRCRQGALITGKRGWGCARWREGCAFVVWFETEGKRLTAKMLEELVTKGKTRRSVFAPGGSGPVEGRLVLDVAASGGARFVPAR